MNCWKYSILVRAISTARYESSLINCRKSDWWLPVNIDYPSIKLTTRSRSRWRKPAVGTAFASAKAWALPNRGEWLSLLGGNGSDKSTLLKLLSHLLKPQQGIAWLDGKAIHTEPTHLVAQKMALLPQQQTIPSGLTVQQLVSLGRTPHQPWYQWELTAVVGKASAMRNRSQVDRSMMLTQVVEFADRSVESLSGGERQRY